MLAGIVLKTSPDRVPLREKAAFAAGTGMDALSVGMITGVLWMPYFNLGLGINAAVLGGVLMVFRLWDAISDPVMGNISDNARTRWGRRRPFMFVGAILTGVLSMGFWAIPETLEHHTFLLCLTVLGLLFFTSFTMWSMPYYALQLELTPDYDERTRVTAWMTGFGKLTMLFGGVVMWAVSQNWFDGIVDGVRTLGPLFALLTIGFGVLPALFVKERVYAGEASTQPKERFWTSVKESFRCTPLWLLIGISFFQVLGGIVVDSLSYYVTLFRVSGGDLAVAGEFELYKKITMVVCGLALIPFWTWLAEKWDKKWVAGLLLCMGVVSQLLSLFCLRPDMPWLQLIPAGFQQGVAAAVWLILPSMKADVADYDELHTGKRREGSLNAFYSWFIKAAVTGSAGITGIVVQYIAGINPALTQQPDEVVDRLVAAYLLIPVVILVVPLYFIWKYPLTRERMKEIRRELEQRRGEL